MKLTTVQEEDQFKPITLNIVLETRREANTFLKVLNVVPASIKDGPPIAGADLVLTDVGISDMLYEIYDALSTKLKVNK
jgi:hypothetical protein